MTNDRDQEARDALRRIQRETETVGTSSLARMGRRVGDHLSGKDAVGAEEGGGTDPIELWGRRIGRSLSVIGVIVLAFWLAVQLELI
jgi:hypothetical protein